MTSMEDDPMKDDPMKDEPMKDDLNGWKQKKMSKALGQTNMNYLD